MPFPNEHSARMKNPDLFVKGSFRSVDLGGGIRVIVGKLEANGPMVAQTYRFDKSKFTPSEAKKWMADHGKKFISFEQASS